MRIPRDYQVAARDQARVYATRGKKNILIAMLMGAGKTGAAMLLMQGAQEKGSRTLFLCDRRMLVNQAADEACEWGVDSGVIMAGKPQNPEATNQFCSKQTLNSWAIKGAKMDLPPADLIVVDEAHRANGVLDRAIREKYPGAIRIGLSATPCDARGNGLGGANWQALVDPIKPSELRSRNLIVPVQCFAPYLPNLRGVKKDDNGEYSARDLSLKMNKKNLIGDVVGWWQKIASDRPSIYFACDIPHAVDLRNEFNKAGVTCELICDETDDDERALIKFKMETREVKVVVNYGVLGEGVSWDFVSCIGLVRPMRKLRNYLQAAGRGLRPFAGKENCIILDHGGCALYHGYPDEDFEWSLDPDANADERNQTAKKAKPERWLRCPECTLMFVSARVCPHCGHSMHAELEGHKVPLDTRGGVLVELGREDGLSPADKKREQQRYWIVCICAAIKKGGKAWLARTMFKGKFGLTPHAAGVSPVPQDEFGWDCPAGVTFREFTAEGRRERKEARKAEQERQEQESLFH